MLKSKAFALAMLLLAVVLTVIVHIFCPTWYWYLTIFMAYMASFCHLCSLIFTALSPRASRILGKTAIVCVCLTVASAILSVVMMVI